MKHLFELILEFGVVQHHPVLFCERLLFLELVLKLLRPRLLNLLIVIAEVCLLLLLLLILKHVLNAFIVFSRRDGLQEREDTIRYI
jgi:hypothetical protein